MEAHLECRTNASSLAGDVVMVYKQVFKEPIWNIYDFLPAVQLLTHNA
jgi:hypothetical protein